MVDGNRWSEGDIAYTGLVLAGTSGAHLKANQRNNGMPDQVATQHLFVCGPDETGCGCHGLHLEPGHWDSVAAAVLERVCGINISIFDNIEAGRRRRASHEIFDATAVA